MIMKRSLNISLYTSGIDRSCMFGFWIGRETGGTFLGWGTGDEIFCGNVGDCNNYKDCTIIIITSNEKILKM